MSIYQFNEIEGLRLAEEIEKQGALFYRKILNVKRLSKIHDVLEALVDEERRHALEFANMISLTQFERCHTLGNVGEAERLYPDDETSVFLSALAGDIVCPGGLVRHALTYGDDASSLLKYAIQMEKDAIMLYEKLIFRAKTDEAVKVFNDVIVEEHKHLDSLEDKLLDCV